MDSTVRMIRPLPRSEEYLGPARVTELRPPLVAVRLPDGAAVDAELAFAMPYAARGGSSSAQVQPGGGPAASGL